MKDISLTLNVLNGDFNLLDDNETLMQCEDIILKNSHGNIISNLNLGVGIVNMLNGPSDIVRINGLIRRELGKDNIDVESLNINNGNIIITAKNK